ncbi:MAG: ABC transporter ATP-binding protein [Anaerolineaceae bacterium]|nr:ABC transporter ATP-binding protein [Anaerolineaceae bacterium]MDD4042447.1 ABC transporter ATP-binding protein [Anaerolineaceae bacterium]MDD4577154.1 ABC transporter ATP-binding protein [Anaerolineaceae bacterium]
MTEIVSVINLIKAYPGFQLKNVTFSIEPGRIMGFIGRNGAGKTTTMKSMLNLVHPDRGEIRFFGLDIRQHEFEIKQRLSFISGGVDYYAQIKLDKISAVYRRFYSSWDESLYRDYLLRFGLDPQKRIKELSQGMAIKFALALGLSHHAELLILDEPTSGLDPISRDELLTIFEELVDKEGATVFFSTHITSDLDKCADDVTYIQDGKIVASMGREALVDSWRVVEGRTDELSDELRGRLTGFHERRGEFSGLLLKEDLAKAGGFRVSEADLEAIMVYSERTATNEKPAL